MVKETEKRMLNENKHDNLKRVLLLSEKEVTIKKLGDLKMKWQRQTTAIAIKSTNTRKTILAMKGFYHQLMALSHKDMKYLVPFRHVKNISEHIQKQRTWTTNSYDAYIGYVVTGIKRKVQVIKQNYTVTAHSTKQWGNLVSYLYLIPTNSLLIP